MGQAGFEPAAVGLTVLRRCARTPMLERKHAWLTQTGPPDLWVWLTLFGAFGAHLYPNLYPHPAEVVRIGEAGRALVDGGMAA